MDTPIDRSGDVVTLPTDRSHDLVVVPTDRYHVMMAYDDLVTLLYVEIGKLQPDEERMSACLLALSPFHKYSDLSRTNGPRAAIVAFAELATLSSAVGLVRLYATNPQARVPHQCGLPPFPQLDEKEYSKTQQQYIRDGNNMAHWQREARGLLSHATDATKHQELEYALVSLELEYLAAGHNFAGRHWQVMSRTLSVAKKDHEKLRLCARALWQRLDQLCLEARQIYETLRRMQVRYANTVSH